MTRHRTHPSARTRRLVSLTVVLSLVVSALMPLAQALASPAGSGALLAAICSPSGLRYVEIDLGLAEAEAPRPPDLGILDHCPGCLGTAPAVLPVVAMVPPPPAEESAASASTEQAVTPVAYARFQPRAPPQAS